MECVTMDRRTALNFIAGATGLVVFGKHLVALGSLPPVLVYRNPGCSCCEKWKRLMAEAGFDIKMEDKRNLTVWAAQKLGVPERLQGCHTGTVGNYFISGHIPPNDIIRLLREMPNVKGL